MNKVILFPNVCTIVELNNNIKSRKGKHLEYRERQSIERWHNREKLKKVTKAKLLDRTEKTKRTEIYYAHPYRSGERGSNEDANRLIRRFIPKGTVITEISEEFIKEVENWINNLLRPMFGFKSSLEMIKLTS